MRTINDGIRERMLGFDPTTKQAQNGFQEGIPLSDEKREYLLPHFTMMLIGKPGSGKTSLLEHMFSSKGLYGEDGQSFNRVLLISPSAMKVDIQTNKKYKHTEFDLVWIFQQLMELLELQEERYMAVYKLQNNGTEDVRLRALTQDQSLQGGVHQDISHARRAGVQEGHTQHRKFKQTNSIFKGVDFESHARRIREITPYQAHHRTPSRQKFQYGEFQLGQKRRRKGALSGRDRRRPTGQQIKTQRDFEKLQADQGGDSSGVTPFTKYIERVANLHNMIMNNLSPNSRREIYLNVCLVLDDVVSDIKTAEHEQLLGQLFFNRRHLLPNGMLSIIVVSQKYTMIPVRIRSNASWILMFKLNPVDFKNVHEDVVTLQRASWERILEFVFGSDDDILGAETNVMPRHQFKTLGIWVEKDKYFKQFELIINSF